MSSCFKKTTIKLFIFENSNYTQNSEKESYKSGEHFADLLVCGPVTNARLQLSDKELVSHVELGNAVKDDVNVGDLQHALRRPDAVAERLHILQ